MRGLIIICAACMQLSGSYGYPAQSGQPSRNGGHNGVASFAYQDSSGNRYGGTYGLRDGQVVDAQGDFGPFGINTFQDFQDSQDEDDFFPEYFRTFENLLQEAFGNHLEQQKAALYAAMKAYDLTSNQAAYIPYLPNRFGNYGGMNSMPGFNNFGSNFGRPAGLNSAFTSGMVGPGFTHQVAAINPANPGMENIDVTSFSDRQESGKPQFYSVSSKSYSSSSDINGEKVNNRGAETMVNDNGRITQYKVQS